MVVRDREGHTADFLLSKLDAQHIQEALAPLIDRASVLCTDGASVYSAFARRCGITHRVVHAKSGQRVHAGAFHIQNVNAYHSRLKGRMRRFHGVATRYLIHYLGWRRMLERYAATICAAHRLQEAVGRPSQHATGT